MVPEAISLSAEWQDRVKKNLRIITRKPDKVGLR